MSLHIALILTPTPERPEVETDGRGGATMSLPQGADYSLTESALIPFQDESTHA